MFRTNSGRELTSQDFNTLCEGHGMIRDHIALYMLQQNSVVERQNPTLIEMTRSIFKAKQVPNYLWGEAINHATYIINCIPTKVVKETTLY